MLQLDPAYPALWRTPDRLQFGADGGTLLDDPPPWQLRLLHELERGLPETAVVPVALAFGGTAEAARAMVRRLRPVLAAAPRRPPTVGARAAAHAPAGAADVVVRALRTAGSTVVDADAADVVVLVAAHVVAPVDIAALMRDDRTHVPVVFTGTGAVVGPVVHPGVTACLMCVHAERTDDDPAWPAIASQLLWRPAPTVHSGIDVEAGIVAARMLAGDRAHPSSRSLTLRADDPARTWRVHRLRRDCGCRMPAGLAETATERPTTRSTAHAVPA